MLLKWAVFPDWWQCPPLQTGFSRSCWVIAHTAIYVAWLSDSWLTTARFKSSWTGKSQAVFPPGFKLGTFLVWGERDNHYATETCKYHGQGCGHVQTRTSLPSIAAFLFPRLDGRFETGFSHSYSVTDFSDSKCYRHRNCKHPFCRKQSLMANLAIGQKVREKKTAPTAPTTTAEEQEKFAMKK